MLCQAELADFYCASQSLACTLIYLLLVSYCLWFWLKRLALQSWEGHSEWVCEGLLRKQTQEVRPDSLFQPVPPREVWTSQSLSWSSSCV